MGGGAAAESPRGSEGMEVAIEQGATGRKTSSRGGNDRFTAGNRAVEVQPRTGPQRLSVRRGEGKREKST